MSKTAWLNQAMGLSETMKVLIYKFLSTASNYPNPNL